MAVNNRTAADLKSIVIETFLTFDRAARQIQELKLTMDTLSDAQLNAQLGLASDSEANSVKGVGANMVAALGGTSAYNPVLLRTLLGVHPV